MIVTRRLMAVLLTATLLASGAGCAAAEGLGLRKVIAQEPQGGQAGYGDPSLQAPALLSLEQAIELALRYNPEVAIAEQGIVVSRGQLVQAMSFFMPRLEVQATRFTPLNLPELTFQKRGPTTETTFTLSQRLYTGGSVQQGVAAGRSLLRGSQGGLVRARQQVAFAVRQTYYAVLTAEEGVKVAEDVVSSAQEHLRVARLRYQAGVAPQYDVLAAEARVARVEQELISAQSGRDTAWATLATVLGVEIPEGAKLSTPRPVETVPAGLPELIEEAMAGRPDLETAAMQKAAAKAQLAVARAERLPAVTGAISWTQRQQVTLPGEQLGLPPGSEVVTSQSGGSIALAATWSLFTGGFVHGNIRAAEARQRQAEEQVESLKLQIRLDVKTAYFALQGARAQLVAARKEVEQAQEAHRIATLRYQEGVGTSVEILDAQANLAGGRTRLNQAIFGLNLALAQLDLATGRDYQATPVSGAETAPGA